MEVTDPVTIQGGRDTFVSDLILLSVFLSVLSADYLRFVKLWGCGKNVVFDFFVEFGEAKSVERTGDQSWKHLDTLTLLIQINIKRLRLYL